MTEGSPEKGYLPEGPYSILHGTERARNGGKYSDDLVRYGPANPAGRKLGMGVATQPPRSRTLMSYYG